MLEKTLEDLSLIQIRRRGNALSAMVMWNLNTIFLGLSLCQDYLEKPKMALGYYCL